MIKFVLYGLITFLETWAGVQIFGKMFPRGEKTWKRCYAMFAGMIALIIASTYKMSKLFGSITEENKRYWALAGAVYTVFIAVCFLFHIRKKEKDQSFFQRILFISFVFVLTEQYWMTYQSTSMIVLGNIFPVFYLYIFYQSTFVQAYLWEALYLSNISILKEVVVAYTGTFQNRYFEDFFAYPRAHTWSEILCYLIICMACLLIGKSDFVVSAIKRILTENKKEAFALMCGEQILLRVLMNFGLGKINENRLTITLGASAVIIIVLVLSCFRLQKKITEADNSMINIRYETMREQYEEIKSAYEGYRCLVHDEKHLISYMEECLDHGDVAEAQKFLSSYRKSTISRNRTIWTGLPTLDFMLSIKNRKMIKSGIAFKLDAQVETVPMEDADCVLLLGNLLDNAIEAAGQCPDGEKTIFCTIRNANSMFIVKLKNSSVCAPKVAGGRFFTGKEEKENHGWGIESVKRIVEKYEGEIEFRYDSSWFEVTVMIGAEEV